MDQLRVVMQHVKKHHFWLLCVVCLIAGFFAWNSASGELSKDYDQRKGVIGGKFSGLIAILSEPNFPNAQWQEETDKLNDEQKKRVRTAWQQVYDEQAPFFKWPEHLEVHHELRGDAGIPMESKPRNSGLSPSYCEQYQSLVRQEFQKLLDIVGAQKYGNRGAGDGAANMQSRVVWNDTSQMGIDESLRFDSRPSSLEVWMTQENLWVYQVLLTIIKKVNADNNVPPVKKIDEILIAQDAATAFESGLAPGKIAVPKNASAGGNTPNNSGGSPQATGMEGVEPPLDSGRYVDATGNPMPVAPGPQQPFKRMPIFLKLIIDQRKIGDLLVECANSPLPVEVRQLRVDPGKSDSGSGGSRRAGAEAVGPVTDLVSYDVAIEIGGIIYLYNPPDTARLGSDADGATVVPGE